MAERGRWRIDCEKRLSLDVEKDLSMGTGRGLQALLED